jgi:hypothetical protein
MTETWDQWRRRMERKQDRDALDPSTPPRRCRIQAPVRYGGMPLECWYKPWGSDPRYERCIYHGETRESPTFETAKREARIQAAVDEYERKKGHAMAASSSFTEIMTTIAELARTLGVHHINQLVGCWEMDVNEDWWFALNGHDDVVVCSHGVKVQPYTAYVEWQGWPAGMVDPYGGMLAAAGESANEDTFLAALRQRIEMAKRMEGKIQ